MGVVSVMAPVGESSVAAPSGAGPLTVKERELLHGPKPARFQVWIHHRPAPAASAVPGVTEQVPVPLGQPAAEAVFHRLMF